MARRVGNRSGEGDQRGVNELSAIVNKCSEGFICNSSGRAGRTGRPGWAGRTGRAGISSGPGRARDAIFTCRTGRACVSGGAASSRGPCRACRPFEADDGWTGRGAVVLRLASTGGGDARSVKGTAGNSDARMIRAVIDRQIDHPFQVA